jgi:hypothetical protein
LGGASLAPSDRDAADVAVARAPTAGSARVRAPPHSTPRRRLGSMLPPGQACASFSQASGEPSDGMRIGPAGRHSPGGTIEAARTSRVEHWTRSTWTRSTFDMTLHSFRRLHDHQAHHCTLPFVRGQLPGCWRYREKAEERSVQIARCHSEEAEWDKGRSLLETCIASQKEESYLQGRRQLEEGTPVYGTNLSRQRATGRSEVFIRCTPFVFTPTSALLPLLPDNIISSHSDNPYFSCSGVEGPRSTCLRLFVNDSVYDIHTLVTDIHEVCRLHMQRYPNDPPPFVPNLWGLAISICRSRLRKSR